MYESSGWQFYRTTTGIKWGQDAFDKSRFVITTLTILRVAEILCRKRLSLTFGSKLDEIQRLTSGEEGYPLDNSLKLVVGQPNNR